MFIQRGYDLHAYSYTADWAIARSVGSVATPFGYHLGMLQHPPSGSTPAHASSAAGPKGYPPRPGAGIITGRHCRDRSAGEGGEKEGTHAASEGGPETRRRRASLARPFRPAMHPNGRRHPNATTAAWASHSRKPGPGQRQIRTSRTPAGPFLSLPYLPTYCTITPPSTNQTSQRNTTEDPCMI